MPKTVGKVPDRKAVAQIGKVYESAGIRLRDIFLSVMPGSFKTQNIPKAMGQVRTVVNGLDRISIKWAPPSTKEAYNEAAAINRTRARALGFEPNPKYDKDNHARTIEATQEAMTQDLVDANQSILVGAQSYFSSLAELGKEATELKAFWDMRDEEIIAGLLDDAIRDGESRQALSKKLLTYFRGLFGEMQFITINGRNYQMKYYAELVGRTRLRHVQSESTLNMAAEYQMDLVEISNHGTTTVVCQEFEGNVYSISGKTKGYSKLKQEPPFHPNCWHNMFVTSLGAIQVRKKYGQE